MFYVGQCKILGSEILHASLYFRVDWVVYVDKETLDWFGLVSYQVKIL